MSCCLSVFTFENFSCRSWNNRSQTVSLVNWSHPRRCRSWRSTTRWWMICWATRRADQLEGWRWRLEKVESSLWMGLRLRWNLYVTFIYGVHNVTWFRWSKDFFSEKLIHLETYVRWWTRRRRSLRWWRRVRRAGTRARPRWTSAAVAPTQYSGFTTAVCYRFLSTNSVLVNSVATDLAWS